MEQESEKIMKMIERGTITANDGQQLLQAINKGKHQVKERKKKMLGQMLHININSYEIDQVIDINIPLRLTQSILKMKCIQKQIKSPLNSDLEIDLDELIELINQQDTDEIMSLQTNSTSIQVSVK